jgi:hypothetical protein
MQIELTVDNKSRQLYVVISEIDKSQIMQVKKDIEFLEDYIGRKLTYRTMWSIENTLRNDLRNYPHLSIFWKD